MNYILNLLTYTLVHVWGTLASNWIYLALSVLIATLLKLYVDSDKVSAFLRRNRQTGVVAATAAAVGTPLCSCGTTAVILGMMASMMPWAPIVAFMVASPLTSPQELVYSAGLFGWPFALAFFLASIFLGLVGGLAAGIFESMGWLAGQARYVAACCSAKLQVKEARVDFPQFAREFYSIGKRLLVMFLGFAFIGYLLNGMIPSSWVGAVFGAGHAYSVPLAATLGLPFYLNTEASLPLVRAMLDSGMSQGAALAFMISGAGTSIGAVAGALTIARWRVIGLVLGVLWAGAILFGFGYDLLLAAGVL